MSPNPAMRLFSTSCVAFPRARYRRYEKPANNYRPANAPERAIYALNGGRGVETGACYWLMYVYPNMVGFCDTSLKLGTPRDPRYFANWDIAIRGSNTRLPTFPAGGNFYVVT